MHSALWVSQTAVMIFSNSSNVIALIGWLLISTCGGGEGAPSAHTGLCVCGRMVPAVNAPCGLDGRHSAANVEV